MQNAKPFTRKAKQIANTLLLKPLGDSWLTGTLIIAVLAAAPILAVAFLAFTANGDFWGHMVENVLPGYIWTTLLLMIGVGLGTFIIGTGTAWLTATCDFPGRKFFSWALFLPMAVPAYIIAYLYTDLLEYAGPIQKTLRGLAGWQTPRDYWFPEIRSVGGATAMMTLVLYPYVYLLARSAFLEQSSAVLEAGRILGRGPWRNFFTIALPLARPALVVGISLVLMEVLNDFGTVDFFAVKTFTAGIYDVWLNMGNVGGAAQLAMILLLFVSLLLFAERWARRKQRFDSPTQRASNHNAQHLEGLNAAFAMIACAIPILLGFIVPASMLVNYSWRFLGDEANEQIWQAAYNSLMLSGLAALVVTAIGLFIAFAVRENGGKTIKAISRIASIGYAIPGAVLAVGVMIPLAGLDNKIDAFFRATFDYSTGLLFSGTIFAILCGYSARFIYLTYSTAEAGLMRITPSMEGAAKTLGASRWEILRTIHMPLLRGSLATAVLLVLVDSMKELPMTMLLRPFNFETLATHVHQYASDEMFEESALAALMIVIAGIIPVILLSLTISKGQQK